MAHGIESLPPFEEALVQLRQLLPDTVGPKDFLWAFREDLGMGKSAPVVLLPALSGNAARVRDIYESVRSEDGGLALVCFGIAGDRPCCFVETARDEDQGERLMLPERGLKASVWQPLRELEMASSAVELAESDQNWEQLGWEAVVSRDDVPERERPAGAGAAALEALRDLPKDDGAISDSDAFGDLLIALEYLLPTLLARRFKSWHRESLDGVLAAHVRRPTDGALEIRGVCILINDQTTAPVFLRLALAHDSDSFTIACRLGEASKGGTEMTRVPYGSSAMGKMMDRVRYDPDGIEWVFELCQRVP